MTEGFIPPCIDWEFDWLFPQGFRFDIPYVGSSLGTKQRVPALFLFLLLKRSAEGGTRGGGVPEIPKTSLAGGQPGQ